MAARLPLAILVLACLASCRSGLQVVGPKGVHVQSPHFDTYTDAGQGSAEALSRLAEEAYPEYCRLFRVSPEARTNVYLFDSTDLFSDYSDRREIWARGYYRHSRNEIILSRKTVGQQMMEDALRSRMQGLTPILEMEENPEAQDTRETFQHELTHAFMDFAKLDLGAWANEGFAEVVGAGHLRDGRLTIGAPQRVSLANLQEAQKAGVTLRVKYLLELPDSEFYEGASPYPESWGLVAFLYQKAGRPDDLTAFLKTLEKLRDHDDIEALEKEWRAWIDSSSPTAGMEAELASPDAPTSRAALQALAMLLTDGAVPEADRARLAQVALEHPNPATKASLRELMFVLAREEVKGEGLDAAMERLLEDPDAPVRGRAATYLVSVSAATPARDARLRGLLQDADSTVRGVALQAVLRAPTRADLPAVDALTKDSSPRVRWLAYETLSRLDAPAEAFAAGMNDPDWSVQYAAATALWKRGKAEGRERLFALAEQKESAPRLFVATSLSMLPIPDAELYDKLAHDASGTVRIMADRRWAARGRKEAEEALARALSDPMEEVRVAAIDALLDEKADRAQERALALLADPSPWVRTRAARLVGQWRTSAAKPSLSKLLSDAAPTVRHEAAVALGLMGDESGVPVLLDELEGKEWAEQRRAILALHKMTGETFGFHWSAPSKRRKEAIARWREWWKAKGR